MSCRNSTEGHEGRKVEALFVPFVAFCSKRLSPIRAARRRSEFRVGEPPEMTHHAHSEPRPLSHMNKFTRRDASKTAGAITGASVLASMTGCEKSSSTSTSGTDNGGGSKSFAHEEYVWLSANANLPLFSAHDHPE